MTNTLNKQQNNWSEEFGNQYIDRTVYKKDTSLVDQMFLIRKNNA